MHSRARSDQTVVGKLLHYTKRDHLSYIDKFRFWRKYRDDVKLRIQNLKAETGKHIRQEVIQGKYYTMLIIVQLHSTSDLTSLHLFCNQKFSFHLVLKSEFQNQGDIDDAEDQNVLTDEHFGDIPNSSYGIAHKLMELAWKKQIHTILTINTEGMDELVQFFYKKCVRNVVGKKTWNQNLECLSLKNFVTFSDEAYAMLYIESNVGKWMDEVRHPNKSRSQRKRSIYTESENGNRNWTDEGIRRFLELCGLCKRCRTDGEHAERMLQIDQIVRSREDGTGRGRKRRRELSTEDGNPECRKNMEDILLRMADNDPGVELPDMSEYGDSSSSHEAQPL